MPPYVTQKTDRETSCWECEILEERLNAVTDSIVEILEREFSREEEKLQHLDEALDERQRVLENYLEHLEDHRPAIAA
jgi:tRNA/tmRNA/rRNA uracil-C5-methylase (TrmA/RlmC/RlmD family)